MEAPTVVVIEQDPLMRELVTEWLAGEGYLVRTWNGVAPAPAVDPALVIVNVCKPRYGGASGVRDVQSAFPDTPVIAISGRFQPGLCGAGTTARALGVRQVIAKPFGRTQLLAAVRDIARPAGA